MVDILRMIDPLPIKEEQRQKSESILSSNLPSSSSSYQQRKYQRPSYHYNQRRLQLQQRNESTEVEDVFVDDEIPTITASINKAANTSNEHKNASTIFNNDEQKQASSLISTDTDGKDTTNTIATQSTIDEPLSEGLTNEESSTSTSTAHTTN